MSRRQEVPQMAVNVEHSADLNARFENITVSNSKAHIGNVYHFHESSSNDCTPGQAALKALLDELAYPEMRDRFYSLNDPYPDTFKWILGLSENDEQSEPLFYGKTPHWDSFTDWLEGGSYPYWISGKLGTGKSILMKYIVESLTDDQRSSDEETNRIVVSHFFWEPGAELQRSAAGCLRSLLCQLLPIQPQETILRMAKARNVHSINRLRQELISCAKRVDKTLIVVLDGLDECHETDDVLDLVDALAALDHVKLCVSSRPEEVYTVNFSHFQKLRLQDLNEMDIRHVVRTELLENPRVRRSKSWNPETANQLMWHILDKAEGVFLWVRLVIKDLLRGFTGRDSLDQMYERLEKLPNEVYELYTALTHRNHENPPEYANQAAFYCRLVMESSELEISLLSFYFATHGQMRARFLDTETIFDQSLEEFDGEIDCELLMTWINVRTAGLLEVKQIKRKILLYEYRNLPRPSFIKFNKRRVGFVHRSAYTYLENTVSGRELTQKCPLSQEEIKTIYFQSQLVTHFVIHAMIYKYVPPNLCDLFLPLTGTNTLFRDCYGLLQQVCDQLLTRGLISTIGDWIVLGGNHDMYPTSKYRNVDLCPLLAYEGHFEMVEILTHEYDCRDDHEYMSSIMLLLVREYLYDSKDITHLLQGLSTHASALNQVRLSRSNEEFCLMYDLAIVAANGWHRDGWRSPSASSALLQFIQYHMADVDLCLLPLSTGLVAHVLASNNRFSVYFSLSMKTLQAWTQGTDQGRRSYHGRSLFFSESDCRNRTSRKLRLIHPSDSDEVLEILRLNVAGLSITNRMQYHWSRSFKGAWVSCDDDLELWQSLKPIVERSCYADSFIDCLRYIGKSEETIEFFVREQVRLEKVNRNLQFVHENLFEIFKWLLGKQNLASWCQKIPQLESLLGLEVDSGNDSS